MKLAHKFRLYPTKTQQEKLSQHFGANRWIYNYFIEYSWNQYKETKRTPSHFDMNNILPKLKQENVWLKEVQAQSLQNTLKNLRSAFVRVMRKQGGPPKYKSRFNRQSVGYPQNCKIENSKIYIPKIGWIKFRGLPEHAEYNTRTVTVSLNKDGKYYASFGYEKNTHKQKQTNNIVGIDLGINTLVTTSDGEKIDGKDIVNNYDIQEQQLELKIKELNKKLSRQQKGSNRRRKTREKLAETYAKLARLRNDMLHKLTNKTIKKYDVISIEDLHVRGMLKHKKLASKIHKANWGEFRRQLTYKTELYGKTIIVIDRFYPSSKTCSDCGHIYKELKLGEEEWTCNECGVVHDRDINAALNIRERGRLGRLTSINIARGEKVRPNTIGAKAVSMKREVAANNKLD